MNSLLLREKESHININATPLKKIKLNGKVYRIYWTVHAQNRAKSRGNSSVTILNTYLSNTLKTVSKLKNFDSLDNQYVTLRDFYTKQFTVIYICKEKSEIKVITCADINVYPQDGDVYIQRNEDSTAKLIIWKKHKKMQNAIIQKK